MDYKLLLSVLLSFVSTISCEHFENTENLTSVLSIAEGLFRQGRAHTNLVYANLISCAIRYDTGCFVDAAGEYFDERKNELLAQADLAALKGTGRADPENTPSHVAKSIEKLLSELSGLFKDSFLSFFNGREDDENEVVDADDKDNGTSRAVSEEMRELTKKKKKKPLKSLIYVIKIGILAAIVGGKILLLLKIFEAGIKFKFLLISAGGFLINALKFWFEMKSNKHNNESIVYKNPYEHEGDWSSGGPGEYNARAYDTRKEHGQNLAYKGYKPV